MDNAPSVLPIVDSSVTEDSESGSLRRSSRIRNRETRPPPAEEQMSIPDLVRLNARERARLDMYEKKVERAYDAIVATETRRKLLGLELIDLERRLAEMSSDDEVCILSYSHFRPRLMRPSLQEEDTIFTGKLSSKNKSELQDIAWALGLQILHCTKPDLLLNIKNHFAQHPERRDDPRFCGLFRRTPRQSLQNDENLPPMTQANLAAGPSNLSHALSTFVQGQHCSLAGHQVSTAGPSYMPFNYEH